VATEPELMRSAFKEEDKEESINIKVSFFDKIDISTYNFFHDNKEYQAWNCYTSGDSNFIVSLFSSRQK